MLLLNNNLPPAFLRHPIPPPFGPLFDTAQAMRAIRADAIAEHGRALDEKYRIQFAALERVLDKKYRDQYAARERALDETYRSQYQRAFRKKWERSRHRAWGVGVLAILLSGCVGWILATHPGRLRGERTMPPLAAPAVPANVAPVAPRSMAEPRQDASFPTAATPDAVSPGGDPVDVPAPPGPRAQGKQVDIQPVPRLAVDESFTARWHGGRDDITSVAHLRPGAGRHGLPRFAYLAPAPSPAEPLPAAELEAENEVPPASVDPVMPAPPAPPSSFSGA